MGVYSKYLYELIQSVAYSLSDCKVVTAASGSSNTLLVNTQLTEGDDFYNGWWAHVFAGTNAGLTRRVDDFLNEDNTAIVKPAFTSALATNSQVELHKIFTYEQYKDAINRAIELGKDEYYLDKIDETLTLSTDVYEYTVPSGFRYITSVYLEDSNDANTYYDSCLLDNRHFTTIPYNSTANKLKFHDNTYAIGASVNGLKLRIIGLATQTSLSNDSDTCQLPPEFVIQQARALLLETIDGKQSLADRAQAKAQMERRLMRRPLPAGAKSVLEG